MSKRSSQGQQLGPARGQGLFKSKKRGTGPARFQSVLVSSSSSQVEEQIETEAQILKRTGYCLRVRKATAKIVYPPSKGVECKFSDDPVENAETLLVFSDSDDSEDVMNAEVNSTSSENDEMIEIEDEVLIAQEFSDEEMDTTDEQIIRTLLNEMVNAVVEQEDTARSLEVSDESDTDRPKKILEAEYQALTLSQQAKVDSFEIVTCSFSFEEYKSENSRLLELYNVDKDLMSCAICAHKGIKLEHAKGNGFHKISTPQKFYQHYERFHKEPIICVVCNQIFDTKRNLRGHMESSKSKMDPAHVKQKQLEDEDRKKEKEMREQKKKSKGQRKKLRDRFNKKK